MCCKICVFQKQCDKILNISFIIVGNIVLKIDEVDCLLRGVTYFVSVFQLDAGVPEKISLISRDEKSVLVVTYSDLKRCFENTFQELIAAANGQL